MKSRIHNPSPRKGLISVESNAFQCIALCNVVQSAYSVFQCSAMYDEVCNVQSSAVLGELALLESVQCEQCSVESGG